ncbi:hypothetical protein ACFX1T_014361 [Malus domestica]
MRTLGFSWPPIPWARVLPDQETNVMRTLGSTWATHSLGSRSSRSGDAAAVRFETIIGFIFEPQNYCWA